VSGHISPVVQVKGLLFDKREVPASYYLVFDEQKIKGKDATFTRVSSGPRSFFLTWSVKTVLDAN
jgi:hypothetical protein